MLSGVNARPEGPLASPHRLNHPCDINAYAHTMLFNVQVTGEGERTVLHVLGDVDLASLPILAGHIGATQGEALEIDLSSVDHFDPLAMGALLAAKLRMRRRNGTLSIVCPPGRTRSVLEDCGLTSVLTVKDGALPARDSDLPVQDGQVRDGE